MADNHRSKEQRLHLAGWGLFIICAIFFIASSVASGDRLGLAASLVFLLACIFFIIPLLEKPEQ
jgi:4-amino-4-deoxy-L-arabinose transferase-like glycosyltransferase